MANQKKNPVLNFQNLVILVLVLVVFLQRCGTGPKADLPKSKIDTLYKVSVKYVPVRDTVYAKPKPVAPPKMDTSWRDTIRLKDSSYQHLYDRYVQLGDKYYSSTSFEQKLNVDTIGSITIKDTVSANTITGRSVSYNLKYPVINKETTITIREPYKPTRQIYIGGGVWGSQSKIVNGANVGALYKDRKDRMFGVNVGMFNNQVSYGVSSYWKIRLK